MQETQHSTLPVVVDLGKISRKDARRLKRGEDPLDKEVEEAVAQVRAELGADADNKLLVPVVVVYARKRNKRRSIVDLLLD